MKIWLKTITLVGLAILPATPLRAQAGVDELHTNALTAMNFAKAQGMPEGAEKWAEALGYLREATSTYDARAMQLFGPKFGWFWYHQGFCELKLERYEEAMKSFETCYKKYPNKNGAEDTNIYHKKSLLKWGEAAQGAEQWETAITQFKKFLAERDPDRDKFPRGAFYVNMAICHFKSGKLAGGVENLEIAIKNKNTFPTPPQGIMAGFQAFCETVIAGNKEQAFIDFVNKNRADITLDPWMAQPYSPVFMKFAADALAAEMPRASFELYALVPSSVDAEDDLRAQLEAIGEFERTFNDGFRIYNKGALERQLSLTKEREKNGQLPEITALAATAYIHEQNGNVRGAYAAYDMLEKFHSNSPKDRREQYLYNLVRTSSLVGRVLETEEHGQRFLKLFPGSQYEESVRQLMLTSLFFNGEYETCLEVANVMLPGLSEGTKQHDICLHVLGGSYYYTGQFDKALKPLSEHVKTYPESDFKIASRYFEASNWAALQNWPKAASLLDSFLAEFPSPKENIYIPFALYDRANCHFAQDELEEALEKLNRVESEFPDANNREMVFNLKGNVFHTQGQREEAEDYYTKALNLAERKENDVVAGEALYYLVGLLGEEKVGNEPNPRLQDAIPFYDEFWELYGDSSPYKAQVAVAGLAPLESANRGEEGLERLQGVIAQLAKTPGAFGLEEAINSFTKFYLKSHSDEELKDLYYNFPDIGSGEKAAQALLRIALIGVYEDKLEVARKEKNDSAISQANASIKVLFDDLKQDFDLKTLSNFILVSVGDYLREKTNSPRQAIPYYEEVLSRTDLSYRFPAMFGLADIYGNSSSDSDLSKAVEQLMDVYDSSTDKKERERAYYRAIEILAKQEKWEEAKKHARIFLDAGVKEQGDKLNFNTYAPDVSLILGKAYRQLGETENAIAVFSQTYLAYRGYIKVAAQALAGYMELLWDRNKPGSEGKPSDRQSAYNIGQSYLEKTQQIRDGRQITDEEKEYWDEVEDLVETYAANPSVTRASEQ
ncbi:MAG: tetratricopeptide repeat protein [Verrucomicrobiota bacterium JB023]|nr:tetratricopeptide repeat protein [Verrucomicrobiota bacterium JB023]